VNKFILLTGMLLFSGATSAAQMVDHAAMDHGVTAPVATESSKVAAPVEPGQSAYAALGETVRILLADPATQWSTVDVDALRSHLIDMDNVTLQARVTKSRLPNGAIFRVTGAGPVIQSIQRMTMSHLAQPDFGKPWTMSVQPTPTGADVTVVSSDPADAAEISGLGFFGILTMGRHHQPHHMMMARGMMHH